MKSIETSDELERFLAENPAAMVYFGAETCSVCAVLRPKLQRLVEERFPRFALALVETTRATELAAQQRVFAVPTLAVYFEAREQLRRSRSFSLIELARELERPYALLFA